MLGTRQSGVAAFRLARLPEVVGSIAGDDTVTAAP